MRGVAALALIIALVGGQAHAQQLLLPGPRNIDIQGQPTMSGPRNADFTALTTCMETFDAKLRANRSTPERYQLALSGTCLDEEEEAVRSMRAMFDRMPHPGVSYADAQEITENSIAKLRVTLRQQRAKQLGSYATWYEIGDPSAK